MGLPRFFVSSDYYYDEEGDFGPTFPDFGPCNEIGGPCQLGLKAWRSRKTGPTPRLAVIYCKTHKVNFTIYPPGHVPYGRVSLVELSLSGIPIDKGRDPPFSHTYFDAALDAAAGIAWPKSTEEGSMQPRFLTQCRHLERCCLLFGLNKDEPKWREGVAEQLGIGGLLLEETRHILLTGGYRASGTAVCQILREIRETEATFQRLATCGDYPKFWPQIKRWDKNTYHCSGPGN